MLPTAQLLLALVPPAGAPQAEAPATERRVARAVRTQAPPVIDGRLDDAVWALAPPIGELVQIEPRMGDAPTERTEVRILFDADHLYVGVRCFDSQPESIIATERERDAFLDPDDRVELVFDTYLDRRNAFFFQMNATGSRGDALITNNGADFNKPWDGIWEGESTIDEGGWTAEMALPFKTLNFREGAEQRWGFNVVRFLGRLREQSRWNNPQRNQGLFVIFEAGDLVGLEGIRQGVGLDVVPFWVGRWENDRSGGGEHTLGSPGVDAFYKLTPSMTLSLTANTDFAETEVDQRQINLTRFPLFFPERRDFFLQDSGLFDFADLGNNLIPFFSRRIGISSAGDPVDLLGGAKLTGRSGPWNVGLLDVQLDESAGMDSENVFAARVSRNVGEQSTVGAIVTRGDPESDKENVLAGVDVNWRITDFLGSNNLRASAFLLESEVEDVSGDSRAWGASVRFPNDIWNWAASFREIQANFDPGLGFVPRRDIRRWDASVGWEPRINETIRDLEITAATTVVTGVDDEVQTAETELQPIGVNWESGDSARVEVELVQDILDRSFDIVDDVTIPAGRYDFARYRLEVDSASRRPVNVSVTVEGGSFFDGDRDRYRAEVGWRPGALFTTSAEWELNEIDLPGGAFSTRLWRWRGDFAFSPWVTWSNFVQWDSRSDSVGINSRLRWIVRPGHDVFLVFNETLDTPGDSITAQVQEVAFKVAYTIRF